MKLEKVGNGKTKSLYESFLFVTLMPVFLCGVIMMIACSYLLTDTIERDVQKNHKSIANCVIAGFDTMYPGEYHVVIDDSKTMMFKGDLDLRESYEYLDKVADSSDVGISIIFYDTRLLTTLKGNDGERTVNTGVNQQVFDKVFTNQQESFYDNVIVNGITYFSYYRPLFSQDGTTVIGMIEVASDATIIKQSVNKSITLNVAIILLATLITAFCIVRYASQIISVIKKMMDFMGALSTNDLDASLDYSVRYREDELGVMGRFMVYLQGTLKKLIEYDALTGLYNRRSGETRIEKIAQEYKYFCVAICDIDFFKKFNDSFGHECGDVVLKTVAKVLQDAMIGKGFASRWGGEEFLLVFKDMQLDKAYGILLGIQDTLSKTEVEYQDDKHTVTMTIGVVEHQEENGPFIDIRRADEKLYEGKQNGRNRVVR